MSIEAEQYPARANERDEPGVSTALLPEFSETVWPLTVLCIAVAASVAWSIFLAWILFRTARLLSG